MKHKTVSFLTTVFLIFQMEHKNLLSLEDFLEFKSISITNLGLGKSSEAKFLKFIYEKFLQLKANDHIDIHLRPKSVREFLMKNSMVKTKC
jgi:hypothetical protein